MEQANELARSLTKADAEKLTHEWEFFARDEQLPPGGDWQNWLFLAGRGSGKTRAGAEWVRAKIKQGFGSCALIAPTSADARDVMVEGLAGIMAVCWENDRTLDGTPTARPSYEPSKRRLTWANGATATMFSAEEPDRLRGPQHEFMWADELAAWKVVRETWDMAMFGLRLGPNPQSMITTTPRPIPLIRELLKEKGTVVTRATTFANRLNLAPSFLDKIVRKYEGTRLGRQELQAELLDDVPGALWQRDQIDATRVTKLPEGERLSRIVVAIDPSGSAGPSADGLADDAADIGIVAVGKGKNGHAYVLDDATCNLGPAGWGRVAVNMYFKHKADRIVAERNYGGAMVRHVIRTTDKNVSYREVTASRGKWIRAEPVAALYEQKRVHHLGSFPQLEDELCAFGPDGLADGLSPNRLDALVWAVTDLMFGIEEMTPIFGSYGQG